MDSLNLLIIEYSDILLVQERNGHCLETNIDKIPQFYN
jgi:hypothetical protein